MTEFSIKFDKPRKTYASGDTITGVVNIVSASGSTIQSLMMKFEGYEKSRLVDKQIIFNHKFFLQAARNSFPFQFTLPPKLPSFLKCEYGEIAYRVQAKIIEVGGSKKQVEEEFTVCASLNLSPIVAHPPQPLVRMDTQAVSNSEFINVTLILEKIGFVPGECLRMRVQIENMSRCTVDGFDVILERTITLTGWLPRHEKSETLAIHKGLLRVLPYSTEMLNINEYLIPLDLSPPSSLSYSRYLRIKYDIGVLIKIIGGKKMCLSVPIIMGTHYGAPKEAGPA